MTRRRYQLMILINQSRNHRYPLINRLSTRHPWQSRRVTRVRGSIGRYYDNNRRSPDFERFVKTRITHSTAKKTPFTHFFWFMHEYTYIYMSGPWGLHAILAISTHLYTNKCGSFFHFLSTEVNLNKQAQTAEFGTFWQNLLKTVFLTFFFFPFFCIQGFCT